MILMGRCALVQWDPYETVVMLDRRTGGLLYCVLALTLRSGVAEPHQTSVPAAPLR